MGANALGMGTKCFMYLGRLDNFFNSNAEAVKKLRLVSKIISTYLSECEHPSVDANSEIILWQDDLFDKVYLPGVAFKRWMDGVSWRSSGMILWMASSKGRTKI
jgi:hypothetical protein